MNLRARVPLWSLLVLALLLTGHYLRHRPAAELRLTDWFRPRERPDVTTSTAWMAPVVWEGTFSREVLERHYRRRNVTVGLVVFATGSFADEYLEQFLRSADRHFLRGHRVIFYIMVDALSSLPDFQPSHLRTLRVLRADEGGWWHDPYVLCMRSLGDHIVSHIQDEVDFLFSMAVRQVFRSAVGAEALGSSVAQLHAWWYFRGTERLPYERRPGSAAYIPLGQGDFYYDSSIVGGTPLELLSLVESYLQGVAHDVRNGLNSSYEKHLNKYFLLHKPAKLLSPEYSWDPAFSLPSHVHYVKIARQAKPGLKPWG
ncbi:putative glycosyltransferase 6 domain-containing protein 1 [Tupaia chinensis]|uniref:Glycosyltransferase 6 domain-containing protein 1 n=1 Tax=Tupaia chinensis TaxID=246437 RepID=L8YDI6_TUPCH|nr:putative glycosyltransferase 6 domain-containing protein 1 [Tupaia chinensis]ELV13144.1 Glycosyltransferase 6 domain-containing protein 1 [Tupaia chinensis]